MPTPWDTTNLTPLATFVRTNYTGTTNRVVDLFNPLKNTLNGTALKTVYSFDGIHPNDAGHDITARALFQALNRLKFNFWQITIHQMKELFSIALFLSLTLLSLQQVESTLLAKAIHKPAHFTNPPVASIVPTNPAPVLFTNTFRITNDNGGVWSNICFLSCDQKAWRPIFTNLNVGDVIQIVSTNSTGFLWDVWVHCSIVSNQSTVPSQ
jgi:hypothetical protein